MAPVHRLISQSNSMGSDPHYILSRLSLGLRLQSAETVSSIVEFVRTTGWRRRSHTNTFRQSEPIKSLLEQITGPRNSLVDVKSKLDCWVKELYIEPPVAALKRVIGRLTNSGHYDQALEVSEWAKDKCKFQTSAHAIHLHLLGRVRGCSSAEEYFHSLGKEDKNQKTYGALLGCYVRHLQTEKALSHFQDMKKMGLPLSPRPYNDVMILYSKIGQHEKVLEVLAEMKENEVKPDGFSYAMCVRSLGLRSDLEGVEKVLKEMESERIFNCNAYALAAEFYEKGGLADKALVTFEKAQRERGKTGKKDKMPVFYDKFGEGIQVSYLESELTR